MKTKPKTKLRDPRKMLLLREPLTLPGGQRVTMLREGDADWVLGIETLQMPVPGQAPPSAIMQLGKDPAALQPKVQRVPVPRWQVTIFDRDKGVGFVVFLPHSAAVVCVPIELSDGEVMTSTKAAARREQKARAAEERCGTETGVEASDALAEVES